MKIIIENFEEHPKCNHGPTVLFERLAGSGVKTAFYACSAFRDRKDCSFFQPKLEKSVQKRRRNAIHDDGVLMSKQRRKCNYDDITRYCHTCAQALARSQLQEHNGHNLTQDLTLQQLKRPSKLLRPLDDAKGQAQFHFSQEALNVLTDAILEQKSSLILCIGAPSIFEELQTRQSFKGKTFLLDIDDRFKQFDDGKDNFCHYNMFNHHHFDEKSSEIYQNSISSAAGRKNDVTVVTDPPFGGRVELLANTLKLMQKDFGCTSMNIFWIFPYFMESQIKGVLPTLQMSDYQVTYEESGSYKQGHKGHRKQGSPVRIFTTVPLVKLKLPEDEGYRFCQSCNHFVSSANRHCHECQSCTAKNGGLYKHCHQCQRCVKSSWQHCSSCDRCALLDHPCNLFKSKTKRLKCESK